jgi:hypothetical protein
MSLAGDILHIFRHTPEHTGSEYKMQHAKSQEGNRAFAERIADCFPTAMCGSKSAKRDDESVRVAFNEPSHLAAWRSLCAAIIMNEPNSEKQRRLTQLVTTPPTQIFCDSCKIAT